MGVTAEDWVSQTWVLAGHDAVATLEEPWEPGTLGGLCDDEILLVGDFGL